MASTTKIGCTLPGAACRSAKTFWPKKSTTSTSALVDVTPSYSCQLCEKKSVADDNPRLRASSPIEWIRARR